MIGKADISRRSRLECEWKGVARCARISVQVGLCDHVLARSHIAKTESSVAGCCRGNVNRYVACRCALQRDRDTADARFAVAAAGLSVKFFINQPRNRTEWLIGETNFRRSRIVNHDGDLVRRRADVADEVGLRHIVGAGFHVEEIEHTVAQGGRRSRNRVPSIGRTFQRDRDAGDTLVNCTLARDAVEFLVNRPGNLSKPLITKLDGGCAIR